MKASLITTVLNEEGTIGSFLESVFTQTKKPSEIIIVDGGSNDATLKILKKHSKKLKIFSKKGNRSVGRNFAISKAKNNVIAISDAGCILQKKWFENITKPFEQKDVDVVAGYYKDKSYTVFQKSLTPYVLVMSDRINRKSFLPASRSMALTKNIWKKVGKFPESLSHNEDFAFAKKMEKQNIRKVFVKSAIVYWIPRNNLKEAFIMFFRFAYGDSEARIFRPKVILLFVRYITALILMYLGISTLVVFLYCLFACLILYILWAITKNYNYVNDIRALFLLPLIQLTSDIAILMGTIYGLTNFMNSKYATISRL